MMNYKQLFLNCFAGVCSGFELVPVQVCFIDNGNFPMANKMKIKEQKNKKKCSALFKQMKNVP